MAFDNYNISQSDWVPLNYGHANVLSAMFISQYKHMNVFVCVSLCAVLILIK